MRLVASSFLLVAGALACGGSQSASVDAPAVVAGADTTVTGFSGEHVYFGDPNRRSVDAPVAFPAPGLRYSAVTLHLGLRCPTGGSAPSTRWWTAPASSICTSTTGCATPSTVSAPRSPSWPPASG